MPLSYAELEKFYEGLVVRARRRGIACAITSSIGCASACMSARCVPTCWPSNATAVPMTRRFTPNIWSVSNMPSVCCRLTRCASTG